MGFCPNKSGKRATAHNHVVNGRELQQKLFAPVNINSLPPSTKIHQKHSSKDFVSDFGLQMALLVSTSGTHASLRETCAPGFSERSSERSQDFILTTEKSLVLPILDCCSHLWCPKGTEENQMFSVTSLRYGRRCTFPPMSTAISQRSAYHPSASEASASKLKNSSMPYYSRSGLF